MNNHQVWQKARGGGRGATDIFPGPPGRDGDSLSQPTPYSDE